MTPEFKTIQELNAHAFAAYSQLPLEGQAAVVVQLFETLPRCYQATTLIKCGLAFSESASDGDQVVFELERIPITPFSISRWDLLKAQAQYLLSFRWLSFVAKRLR